MPTFRDALDPSYKMDRRRLYASYILRILGNAAMVALPSLLGPAPFWKMAKQSARAMRLERKKLTQALRRLEHRGLVRRQKRDDGNEYLLLTEAGEQAFLKEKKRALVLQRPKKWDHIWRIVVFDIVEDKKTVREAVRKHLQKLGFYHLQKSVFVTPYPCKEEIRFLQEFYEGESEICLINATSLGEKEVPARKYFNLYR